LAVADVERDRVRLHEGETVCAVGVGGSAPNPPVWSDEICGHKALVEVFGASVPPLVEDLPARRNPNPATAPVPKFAGTSPPKSSLPAEWVVGGKGAPGSATHSRIRYVDIYEDCTPHNAVRFLRNALDYYQRIGIRVLQVQTDHGTEFAFAFVLAVEQAGMQHRYIRPRCPQQNGKVERSHRIDAEEFWSRHEFAGFDEAALAVRDWEQVYNYQCFSMALHGRTPAEKLAAGLQAA
jgi:transposase InsO family protein